MSTLQIRTQLHQYIDHLDERFLNAMFAMVQQYVDNEEIIGTDNTGNPLTQKELLSKVKASHQEYKESKTHSQTDVLVTMKNW